MITKGQKEIYETIGLPSERKAKVQLKEHGFRNIKSFHHRRAGPYDITAKKNGKNWIIEVKSQVT
jgi:Holliday junction resolvase-like predicted endonuclease